MGFKRFLGLFIIALSLSFLIAILLYNNAGNTFSLKGSYIDLDFFNVLFGTFEIVGLSMAIYEISALRSSQKIRADATKQERIKSFKEAWKPPFIQIKAVAQRLQKKINKDVYTESAIVGYAAELNEIINAFEAMDSEQKSIDSVEIIACENCLTLLRNLQLDLYKVVEDQQIEKFKRQHFNSIVSIIIKRVTECEIALRK